MSRLCRVLLPPSLCRVRGYVEPFGAAVSDWSAAHKTPPYALKTSGMAVSMLAMLAAGVTPATAQTTGVQLVIKSTVLDGDPTKARNAQSPNDNPRLLGGGARITNPANPAGQGPNVPILTMLRPTRGAPRADYFRRKPSRRPPATGHCIPMRSAGR
jgi:hypothetical protein